MYMERKNKMIKSEDMVVEVTGPKYKVAVDLLLILNALFIRDVFSKKEILESAEKLKGNKEHTKEDVDAIKELLRKLESNN